MTAPRSPIFHPASQPAPRYVFVYGTLIPGHEADVIKPITGLCKPAGPATVRGRVFCLGPFPALQLDDGTDGGELGWGDVHGVLLELPAEHEKNYEVAIRGLDDWEDYDYENHESENNMYLRLIVNAVIDGVEVPTFIYQYNYPLHESAVWVPSGKWEPTMKIEGDGVEANMMASPYYGQQL